MYGKQLDIRDKLKPVERRLKTLDEHIRQAEDYLQFREINRQYRQQKPKLQKDFYNAHHKEMTLFEAADRYLKGVMNGRTTLPTKAWRAERDKLTADKKQLDGEYRALENDIAKFEKIRKNVYAIMREEQRREQPTRARDMEL